MSSDGCYVTVEGIDGSGTTSVVKRLQSQKYFPDAATTAEPSGLWSGEVARESFEDRDVPPTSRFYYFMADRHAHAKRVLAPALDNGSLVISDRGPDSTRAYQRVTTDLPHEFIEDSLGRVPVVPDLTLWLDVPPEVAAERTSGDDAYEVSAVQRKVALEYMNIWKERDRITRVQADRSLDRVVDTCASLIEHGMDP